MLYSARGIASVVFVLRLAACASVFGRPAGLQNRAAKGRRVARNSVLLKSSEYRARKLDRSMIFHSRQITGVLNVLFCLGLVGCSTPPLWHATNNAPFGKDISVEEVVLRVKCELADSLRKKMEEQRLRWLENWTAKADLTLQVNESGGITPNAVYTNPLHNAFNLGAGPSSRSFPAGSPGNSVAATAQSFNVGIGATYSNQVYRTETISFAVSLRELKAWREKGAGKTANCAPVGSTDLQGDLDLQSWVDTALVPVETGELGLGVHPDPGSKPPSVSEKKAAEVTRSDREAAWISYFAAAAKTSADAATKSSQQAWASYRQAERSDIISAESKRKIHELARAAAKAAAHANEANNNVDKNKRSITELEAQHQAVIADISAEAAALDAAAAKTGVNPDQPIDSISHSLNFIVTAGASVSPNWILLHWKGPANIGSLAGYNGIRTHTLSIALGSPSASINSEANRVLNNEAFRQAIQSP